MNSKTTLARQRENASYRVGVPKECRSGKDGPRRWDIPASLQARLDKLLYPKNVKRGLLELAYRNIRD
jgi:hypothetical protein